MEGYIDKDHVELINKFSVEDSTYSVPVKDPGSFVLSTELFQRDWVRYHIFFHGRIYNLISLSITYVDDLRQDIRKTIFEIFEKYDYDFKKLNAALNGDYALVIIKEVSEKITEVWMSTDHISNIKLWWVTGPEAPDTKGSKIQFSLKEFEGSNLMPAGFMSNIRLNEEGDIKEEIFMEYEEDYTSGERISDLSSAYVLVGFALDCIIEKRLKYTNKIFVSESVYDKYIMKVAKMYAQPRGEDVKNIEECTEPGPKVIRGLIENEVSEEGIYPFLDKTFMRLMSRVDDSIREELLRRLFYGS